MNKHTTRIYRKEFIAVVMLLIIMTTACYAEDSVREISITAEKYQFSPDVIELVKGETVDFTILSSDVNHGFCSKELNIYLEVPAGEEIKYRFTAEKTGTFEFYCCVYCGIGHMKMKGKIIVRDADEVKKEKRQEKDKESEDKK
ncbi:MAG: hypothetical protein A2Y62_12585 [Candidatus Fischerbacteria bacterium RBG_13_37_8]|uniref:Cytochrome oxidase subunit II copper A binding domain-containing protein n=1 Tax=Candidatus Fischerbacteria bacterium RBG_13_37_8 TaxID=1817863 RepID=A0A1F5VUQ4_9BACT|nr:MAG: hypothetical protein A2Y62_12585 [Candidatus Fischerbacteria bacterium RBG_13_37_8]